MFTVNCWKKDGYKLWLTGILIVFLFNWKWALCLTIASVAYFLSLGLVAWWLDSRTKAGQDDFLWCEISKAARYSPCSSLIDGRLVILLWWKTLHAAENFFSHPCGHPYPVSYPNPCHFPSHNDQRSFCRVIVSLPESFPNDRLAEPRSPKWPVLTQLNKASRRSLFEKHFSHWCM